MLYKVFSYLYIIMNPFFGGLIPFILIGEVYNATYTSMLSYVIYSYTWILGYVVFTIIRCNRFE